MLIKEPLKENTSLSVVTFYFILCFTPSLRPSSLLITFSDRVLAFTEKQLMSMWWLEVIVLVRFRLKSLLRVKYLKHKQLTVPLLKCFVPQEAEILLHCCFFLSSLQPLSETFTLPLQPNTHMYSSAHIQTHTHTQNIQVTSW